MTPLYSTHMSPENPSLMRDSCSRLLYSHSWWLPVCITQFRVESNYVFWGDTSKDDEVGGCMTRMGKKRNSCNRAYQIVNRDPSRDTYRRQSRCITVNVFEFEVTSSTTLTTRFLFPCISRDIGVLRRGLFLDLLFTIIFRTSLRNETS